MIRTRLTNVSNAPIRLSNWGISRLVLHPNQPREIRGDINRMFARRPRRMAELNQLIAEGVLKVEVIDLSQQSTAEVPAVAPAAEPKAAVDAPSVVAVDAPAVEAEASSEESDAVSDKSEAEEKPRRRRGRKKKT